MSLANYIDDKGIIDLNQALIVDEPPIQNNHATNKLYVDNANTSLKNEIENINLRLNEIENYLRKLSLTFCIKDNYGNQINFM